MCGKCVGNVCKILSPVFAEALTVQACSMKWLHDGPADNKESKICCFWSLFYSPSKYCPLDYKDFVIQPTLTSTLAPSSSLCFIRQVNTAPLTIKNFVIQPTLSSIDEILNIAGECCTRGQSERSPVNAHLQGASAENLLEEGISYSKQCYKNSTNKIHNGRVKATYEKGKRACTAASLNKRRQG